MASNRTSRLRHFKDEAHPTKHCFRKDIQLVVHAYCATHAQDVSKFRRYPPRKGGFSYPLQIPHQEGSQPLRDTSRRLLKSCRSTVRRREKGSRKQVQSTRWPPTKWPRIARDLSWFRDAERAGTAAEPPALRHLVRILRVATGDKPARSLGCCRWATLGRVRAAR